MNHHPFEILWPERPSRWLVTCDHAANRVPAAILPDGLGLAVSDMERHIAYDLGAAGLACALADRLGCPAILTRFSRLVIDPNRGEDDPTLVMQMYDGTIIPANRVLPETEVERRLNLLYRPYHAALAARAAQRSDTVIVAIHSYTPCLRGREPRPWHVGVLYSKQDPRLSQPLIQRLVADPALCVGDNQPYAGALPGDAIDRHALQMGRQNTLIEVRNDLIATGSEHHHWADILAPALVAALIDAET